MPEPSSTQSDQNFRESSLQKIDAFLELACCKINRHYATTSGSSDHGGSPVFTRNGRYVAFAWTEWTRGFQCGIPLLAYEGTGEEALLNIGKEYTLRYMEPHLTHHGVHDHGFNTISSFGNLWRLGNSSRLSYQPSPWELKLYEMAIRTSGAVQASRWQTTADGFGFVYSFNGPHSLFADTIRSMRVLALAHQLGGCLLGEQDEKISLLHRLLDHAHTTALYTVYNGKGRDIYDTEPGRVAHEITFNPVNGRFRAPSTQQGYSPFSTWTRALAWIVLGYAELLEWLVESVGSAWDYPRLSREEVLEEFKHTARICADYYMKYTPVDGIPYWDTAAPGLQRLGEDYIRKPAMPDNPYEPVDSSAAAIAGQGFLKLARLIPARRSVYEAYAARIITTLFSPPYLAEDPEHEGLILHAVYHRPNGWDLDPEHQGQVPRHEACLWGDYHALELAVAAKEEWGAGIPYRFYAAP
ncbi:MAG: glycosyl hydrolase [Lentisphaerae bacterium]|nr:MAG: glycosyl hydrolase [Lentisphaerota bacterium]